MTRNVTISLDEDTARWVRVEAARRDVSVSRMIAEFLAELRRTSETREAATERLLSRPVRRISGRKRYPKRDDLYDRPRIR